MSQQLGSKLHLAEECLRKDSRKNEKLGNYFKVCRSIPNFVFNHELRDLFKGDKQTIQLSTLSMFKAGVAKLPYPIMMTEVWGGRDDRWFFVLEQTTGTNVFEIAGLQYLHDVEKHLSEEEKGVRTGHAVVGEILLATLTFVEIGHDGEAEWSIKYSDHQDLNREHAVREAIAALNISLIMSQMAELDREVVEPKKLNKARVASGKPSINGHIVIRIGHVYDKEGNKVRITDSNRRSMPIHMRAGHTKAQPHGRPWMDANPEEAMKEGNTATHHIVWIPPVLVNYVDGSPLPVPKPRIVKF